MNINDKGNTALLLCLLVAGLFIGLHSTLKAQATITQDTLQLNEVEIYGKPESIIPVNVIYLKSIETEAVRDIGDRMRQEPNVSGIRKGGVAIDPVIRGFKYDQVTVLLNSGIKIEGGCPNRMDPVTAHVESENLRRIEIVKGPYVLKYGPVLGALVNLESELPYPHEKPEIHAKAILGFESNWNGQREHIALSGGNSQVFFNASGGYKGYGSYTAGNEEEYKTSFRKMYGTAGLGFMVKKNHKIILGYAYDQGEDVMYPSLPMDERLDQTHVGSVNYIYHPMGRLWQSIEFQGYISPVHHVMDNLDRATVKTMQAVTTVDAWNAGGKLNGVLQKGAHKVQIGLDYEHIFKDGEKEMTMEMVMEGDTFTMVKYANVWLDALYNNLGAFVEYELPLKKIDVAAAIRFDYNQATSSDTFRLVSGGISYFDELSSNYFNVSFSLGCKKQIAKRLYLSAAIGRGTRSPSVLERFIKLMPVQYDSYDYLGNPQLKPEINHQADISLQISHPRLGAFQPVFSFP
jgi:iron complex outermembrane receptor protein